MSAIAIFVKTPGFSPVKTRLAQGIGERRAIALYRHCAACVMAVAEEACAGPIYWALAEPEQEAKSRWPGTDCIRQGAGDLGERMHQVLTVLVQRHGSGLLLGADAPQIDAELLGQSGAWLEHPSPRRIIGPARDGGFWTFGANHVPPLSRWTRVPYSRPDTLLKFRESLGDDAAWLDLPMLTDLDTADDMARVVAELAAIPHPLPEQTELMNMLEQLKPA